MFPGEEIPGFNWRGAIPKGHQQCEGGEQTHSGGASELEK